jgi:uncharacterized protein YndB with AHSA1/START domain
LLLELPDDINSAPECMMVKKIVLAVVGVLVVAVAVVLALAATQPDTFRVQRAIAINAPPEKIYPLLSDLRRSVEWSPYEKKDPDMRRTYRGAPSGKGAIYEWDGDSNVGAGRIEIADVSPPSRVVLNLEMIRPFMAQNVVEYSLEPKEGATNVTWSMHGPMPFVSKVMCLFFDMDKMVGNDFEAGLSNLKTLAER